MTRADEPRQPLDTAAAIANPVDRARTLTQIVSEYEALVREAARMRRLAITDAVASGMSQEQLAKALGVTAGRVSQMRKAASDNAATEPGPLAEPVVTGWLAAEPSEPVARIAICGSRAPGTNGEQISAAVPALAELLMRQPYAVSHGPVGIGAEVLTYIADHHQPAGLDAVRGIVGHANVVRDSEYVVVIGGGSGTQAEIDAALANARRVLPMPVSGGAAARAYMRMIEDASLRAWLPDDRFAALATADAARFAEVAETVIARKDEPMPEPHPYVVLSCAMSADGYIDDATDRRLLLSNDADFDRVDSERAASDAILVGANTIRLDNPRLLVRSEDRRAGRVARGLPSSPAKVTITASGSLDPSRTFFTSGDADVPRLVYSATSAAAAARRALEGSRAVEVIPAGDPVDLSAVLSDLGARGVGRLMVEGGTSMHTQFLAAGLVDELQLVVAPFFVGQDAAPRFVGAARFPFDSAHRMTLAGVTQIGDVALLRYVMPGAADRRVSAA